jgi:hypothetical protein
VLERQIDGSDYMIGRHERARYDFERSSGFCDIYYQDLLK